MKRLFLDLDLKDVIEFDDEGEGKEDGEDARVEGVEEPFEVRTEQASAKVAPEALAKEGVVVEEVIAEAMV